MLLPRRRTAAGPEPHPDSWMGPLMFRACLTQTAARTAALALAALCLLPAGGTAASTVLADGATGTAVTQPAPTDNTTDNTGTTVPPGDMGWG